MIFSSLSGLGFCLFWENIILMCVMPALEQDAVNSYVFKLAPKRAGADVLSEKLMWGAPFPVAAHTQNRFYQAVSFIYAAS